MLPNRAIRGWVDSLRAALHPRERTPAARRRQASSVRFGRSCCVGVAGSGRTRHVLRAAARRMLRRMLLCAFRKGRASAGSLAAPLRDPLIEKRKSDRKRSRRLLLTSRRMRRCEHPDNLAAEGVSRALVARYRGWWDERRREAGSYRAPGLEHVPVADAMRYDIFRCSLDTTLRRRQDHGSASCARDRRDGTP